MIAVDWSGRGKPDHRHYIWLCEISGSEVRLESGRLRPAVVEHLVELAGSDSSLVVGLDFAFSAPAWYLAERGLHSPRELWSLLAEEALTERMGEIGFRRWLNEPAGKTGTFTLGSRRRSRNWAASPMSPRSRGAAAMHSDTRRANTACSTATD
jgi:hypothetical protein